jgi:hypothetical protein
MKQAATWKLHNPAPRSYLPLAFFCHSAFSRSLAFWLLSVLPESANGIHSLQPLAQQGKGKLKAHRPS